MMQDDLQKIKRYIDRICAADGSLNALSSKEREDLIVLLEKWCEEKDIDIFLIYPGFLPRDISSTPSGTVSIILQGSITTEPGTNSNFKNSCHVVPIR